MNTLVSNIISVLLLSVDGGWTPWTFWSSCSGICGAAKTTRQRFCTNPTPANGGSDCSGSQTEHNACNVANCPSKHLLK